MIPFFQGKIDNFCAIYAVLNAVQLLCKINAFTARSLFNETVLEISRDYYRFKAVLEHGTDYMELVDHMLGKMCTSYRLLAFKPFEVEQDPKEIWSILSEYARPDLGRCAIFRFLRYEAFNSTPMADHWTTSKKIDSEGLQLFDCSLEPLGLHVIRPKAMVRSKGRHPHEYVVIPAEQIRLLTVPEYL